MKGDGLPMVRRGETLGRASPSLRLRQGACFGPGIAHGARLRTRSVYRAKGLTPNKARCPQNAMPANTAPPATTLMASLAAPAAG